MREISFVKRLKFNFNGSVIKRALVIGDADNDQRNELVCASLQGDLAVFKGSDSKKCAFATDLGMVTACVIGDVMNVGKNLIATINTEGWLYLFELINCSSMGSPACRANTNPLKREEVGANADTSDLAGKQNAPRPASRASVSHRLKSIYDQLMPANCKELLLADLDGDGQMELIVGLTDRVLRTYKWIKIGSDGGKFVGLYKWEFADQIGAVSLNPSRHENCQDIIVAQPGGTYAKLECFDKKPLFNSQADSGNSNGQAPNEATSEGAARQTNQNTDSPGASEDGRGDNVRTEYINQLTPEYHQLALSQMRNHHISTEVLGGVRNGKQSSARSLIAIATLDGTLMLVRKDEIIWSLQVDHQLFALSVLESESSSLDQSGTVSSSDASPALDRHYHDTQSSILQRPSSQYEHSRSLSLARLSQSDSTGTIVQGGVDTSPTPTNESNFMSCFSENNDAQRNFRSGPQYFVACAWNGKTYIIDEERNYLRFKFDEAVSAFTAGNYFFGGSNHASLVYATFNNQIVLFYDVTQDDIRPMYLLDEIMENPENCDLLEKIELLRDKLKLADPDGHDGSCESPNSKDQKRTMRIRQLLEELLYSLDDRELCMSSKSGEKHH